MGVCGVGNTLKIDTLLNVTYFMYSVHRNTRIA